MWTTCRAIFPKYLTLGNQKGEKETIYIALELFSLDLQPSHLTQSQWGYGNPLVLLPSSTPGLRA